MTGRRTAWWVFAAALFLGPSLGPAPAGAQGSEVTVRVSLPVTEAVGLLEVTPASTDFGTLSFEAMSQGFAQREGPTLIARANHAFSVVVSAQDAFTGPATKTQDELQVAASSVPFTSLSESGVVVVSSGAGASLSRVLEYRWLLSEESDPPGSYSLGVNLRLDGG
jgi:hypothetical protein